MIRVGTSFLRAKLVADKLTEAQRAKLVEVARPWFRLVGDFEHLDKRTAAALVARDLLAPVVDPDRPRAELYQPTAFGLVVALLLDESGKDPA